MAAQHLAAALTLLRKQDENPVDPLTLEAALWDNCGDVSSPSRHRPCLRTDMFAPFESMSSWARPFF